MTPRPHQQVALDRVVAAFRAGASRVQIRMACGSGKTLIGLWAAHQLSADTVVIFEPSIALVAQTIERWRVAAPGLRLLAVCGDASSTSGRDEIGADGIDPYAGRRDCGVTTSPSVVAAFLDGRGHGPSVVVSTYHSSAVVAEALQLTDVVREVDLVIADEAHRLAGRTDPRFLPVLDDATVRARRRLFQTATPVVLRNLAAVDPLDELSGASSRIRSMDDARLFGEVVYTLTVGDAIAAGLLADYRVVVAVPRPGDGSSTPDRAALAALADTIERYGVRRILTFHNRVRAAQEFADRVTALGSVGGRPVRGYAVDGSMPDARRRGILAELADSGAGQAVTVVASAQCLREGIDVPAVDAVLFADPRTSTPGIVQAVGRSLRTYPGKTVGTIVVPLVVGVDADTDEALSDSDYSHVWRVLRALRAHDARVGFDIDRARARSSSGARDDAVPPWLHIVGDDRGAVLARLVERVSARWEACYQALAEYGRIHGTVASITTLSVLNGLTVGQFATDQRIRYADDSLDPECARRLEQIPGWRWHSREAADDRSLVALDAVVAEHGSLEPTSGSSIYEGYVDGLNRPLKYWVAAQIFRYHDGDLPRWLAEDLEQRPGWTWSPLPVDDSAPFDAFRQFVAWEGHAIVPRDRIEDGQPIGEWVHEIRRRRVMGTLSPTLEAMILAATPTGHKGERRFPWCTAEVQREIGLEAARQYCARTGTIADLSVGHVEDVSGYSVNLYQWRSRIRYLHNRGDDLGDLAAALTQLPGWNWSARADRAAAIGIQTPIDIGTTPHGQKGYYRGCRCTKCVDDQRQYAREAARATVEKYRHDWLPAADVGAHLRTLRDSDTGTERQITAGAIAAAAVVPVGVIKGLLSGRETRCHPLHHASLLDLTADDVRAVRTVKSSRGRSGIASRGELVDPRRTWQFIDTLYERGWMTGQICAALGYSRRSTLPFTRDRVTHSHEQLVLRLADFLGDRLDPPAPGNRPAPADVAPATRSEDRGNGEVGDDGDAVRWARSLLAQGYQPAHVARRTGVPVHSLPRM